MGRGGEVRIRVLWNVNSASTPSKSFGKVPTIVVLENLLFWKRLLASTKAVLCVAGISKQ